MVINPAIVVSPTSVTGLAIGTVGKAYNQTITASGGAGGTYTFSTTSNLDGLTLSSSGLLNGMPTTAGSFPITVTATDSNNGTGSQNYSLTVIPAAPTGLKALAGSAQVSLTWNASAGAATYDVYRGTTTGGESPTPIATGVVGTTFTNTGLTVGTTYFYVVTAVKGALQSVHSNEASASPNFTDTFHRANSTNLGSNWTTVLGLMGISGNQAAGLSDPALSYVVDLAQVNGISLPMPLPVPWSTSAPPANATPVSLPAVMPPATCTSPCWESTAPGNPAGTPTAALLFRFTPNLPGTQSGGWSFLAYKLLPTPPNTGSANLGLDVTGTGLATTLHLYLNGTLTLTFVESQTPQVYGVSQHPLNNPGGVGLLSVDAGTTYGNFIAGLPGSVPQAQELAGIPRSPMGVPSLTAAELAPIVTAAEARWEGSGLSAAQMTRLQGLQFVVTSLSPGMLGEHVPGVIYLDSTADGWGWFVDPTPGQDEEYASTASSLAGIARQRCGGPSGFADSGDARDGPCPGFAGHHGAGLHRPDGRGGGDGPAPAAVAGGHRCGFRKPGVMLAGLSAAGQKSPRCHRQ